MTTDQLSEAFQRGFLKAAAQTNSVAKPAAGMGSAAKVPAQPSLRPTGPVMSGQAANTNIQPMHMQAPGMPASNVPPPAPPAPNPLPAHSPYGIQPGPIGHARPNLPPETQPWMLRQVEKLWNRVP